MAFENEIRYNRNLNTTATSTHFPEFTKWPIRLVYFGLAWDKIVMHVLFVISALQPDTAKRAANIRSD